MNKLLLKSKHRLMCGDSTNHSDVNRLLDGALVSICFTSPPYAQQRDYGNLAKEKCKDWFELMHDVFSNLPLNKEMQVFVNLGLIHRDNEWIPYWQEWIEWMRSHGWNRFGWYVWDQGSGLPGDWVGRFAPSFEFVFHFNKHGKKPNKWIEKKEESVGIKTGGALRKADGTVPEWYSPHASLQTHKIPDSVIRVGRAKEKWRSDHPAIFPVGLPEYFLKSWDGDVYDPFGGSGTTLVAAHRLNRSSYLMEIEPKFADVILKRAEAEGMECVLCVS